MKKILLSAFLLSTLLGNINVSGQEAIELQKNNHLTNSETNLYNGVPQIGLPLLNVSAMSGINIGVSLSYSTEGASAFKMASDVKKGWSLQYGGSIIKNRTNNEKDFVTDNISGEISSVVYYYNFLGNTGRFYISKDQSTGQPIAIQIQPSKNKIQITKDSSNLDKIASFSITDENGNTFLFNKIDIDRVRVWSLGNNPTSKEKVNNSAFLLTTITNNRNQQVATFEYETTTELISSFVGTLQENKIKKINIANYGNIEFVYQPNGQPHSLKNKGDRDWYQMDKLVLKDKNNQIISQYAFSGEEFLTGLSSLDKNNNVIQKYSFEYNKAYGEPGSVSGVDTYGYKNAYDPCSLAEGALILPSSTNLNTVADNTLKSIILPTGGRIEYEFESNSIEGGNSYNECVNENCYEYYDLDKIYTWTFDSTQSSTGSGFNFPTGYKGDVYVKTELNSYPKTIPPKPGVPYFIDVDLLDLGGNVLPYTPYKDTSNSSDCYNIRVYKYGLISINKGLIRGNLRGYGKLEFYAVKDARKHKNLFGHGLRIKSIRNYDAEAATPSKWVTYEYNKFSDPLTSSGQIVQEDQFGEIHFLNGDKPSETIAYNNVKVTDKIDNSYVKYIFYDEREIDQLSGVHYELIDLSGFLKRAGLLKQKEVYGKGSNLLQETKVSYEMGNQPIANIQNSGVPVKRVFIKKETKITKDYVNGSSQTLINSTENNYDNQFNNLVYSKETLYDGTLIEKNMQYAKEKNNQKLLNANLVGIPLEVEVKNDGKIIGKTETRLDDPATLYPTSVLTLNQQNQNTAKKMSFDNYDDKGNLRESRAENGIPTATVWGYHQTQPIMKITGAAYSDIAGLGTVTAAIAASDADDNDPSNEAALIQALENARKDPGLKNYQIETFTYDPLIGVTSKTAANGLRETYIYDIAHRVSKVLDKDGKIINSYSYNYSPQVYGNDTMAMEYVSNNCGAGFLPNRCMYTVPANTYFSTVSKFDANQKAEQDINTNGQNKANQIGGCRPLVCSISKGYDIATLNSGSLTMPDASNFRLQLSFPFDSSLVWTTGKSIGKMSDNCFSSGGASVSRKLTYGQWTISIYSNGNIRAKSLSATSIPNGTIINIDVTYPVDDLNPDIDIEDI